MPADAPHDIPSGGVLAGLVDHVGARRITGWLAVRRGAPAARVGLFVNDLEVAITRAADRHRFARGSTVRTFHFAVRDLWRYCGPDDRITVRVDGRALPIHGRGLHYRPDSAGEHTAADLAERLAAGWVLGQKGELGLSKQLDTRWQAAVLDAYDRMRSVLAERCGHEAFLVYGSLLGLVREGRFIGHDVDLDAAYLSRHTQPAEVARELHGIGLQLVDAGLGVAAQPTHLKVTDGHGTTVDLFHLYFDAGGRIRFPYGVAGHTEFTRDRWRGPRPAALAGRPVLIPEPAAELVEHIYGTNWRVPLPGFAWKRDRTDRAEAAHLSFTLRDELYWADHYARSDAPDGSVSDLCAALLAGPDRPGAVADLGCGAGQDACAFAAGGRPVVGVDRSAVAIRRAQERARRLGRDAPVQFRTGDLADPAVLTAVVEQARAAAADGPVLLHLNRLLDSLAPAEQDAVLAGIARLVRPGDTVAAEFATGAPSSSRVPDADGQLWAGHYRRWQSGPQLAQRLRREAGLTVAATAGRSEPDAELGAEVELFRVLARR